MFLRVVFSRWHACLALVAAIGLAGCGARETSTPDAPRDAGLRDAGVPTAPVDAGETVEAPATTPATTPALDEEGVLRRDLANLEALLGGELPSDVDPRALFVVDLANEDAVEARRASLRADLGVSEPTQLEDAGVASSEDAGPPQDAGAVDAGTFDAAGLEVDAGLDAGLDSSLDAGRRRRPRTSEPADDAGLGVAVDLEVDAGVDAGVDGGVDAGVVDPLAPLRRRRDELRLRFLSLPRATRTQLLATVEAERSLRRRAEEAALTESQAQAQLRAAEAARAEAVAEASSATTLTAQRNAQRREALATTRAAIADVVARSSSERRRDVEVERERLAEVHRLETRLDEATTGERLAADEVESMYDGLVELLIVTRRDLREALTRDQEELPEVEAAEVDESAELRAERRAAAAARREARETLDRQTREHVDALAEAVSEGNELRLRLFPRLPLDRKARLVSVLDDEGRAQVRREVEQLELMARYGFRHVVEAAPTWPGEAAAALAAPGASGTVLFAFLVIVGTVYAHRRREAWIDRLAARTLAGDVHRRRRFGPWIGRLRAIAGPLVRLLGAWLFFRTLGHEDVRELQLTRSLVLLFFAYRVSVAFVHHALAGRPSRSRAAQSDRVLADVRRVGRFVFVSMMLLWAAEALVGRGSLYAVAWRLLLGAAFVLAVWLVRRWRSALVAAYRDERPDSALAKRLAAATGPRLDVLAIGAGLELAGRRVVEAGRSLTLRFTAGRRAMAKLSRRRLGKADEGEDAVEALDAKELAAFTTAPVPPEEALPIFPKLEELDEVVRRAQKGGRGAAIALVGEAGTGRTTWLRAFVARHENARLLEVPNQAHDAASFVRWLSVELGQEETSSARTLSERLEAAHARGEGPRGPICLDGGQNLFLRCIDGTGGFRALGELLGHTQNTLVWVCAFSANAWRFLRAREGGESFFSRQVVLRGWSESQLARLVEDRAERAQARLDFSALVEPGLSGAAFRRALERAREELYRVLWDVTDGNPRAALVLFRRALRRKEEGVWVVGPIDAVPTAVLEELHDEARFLLASVVLHEDLSAEDAARVLRWPLARCDALLDALAARDFLEPSTPGPNFVPGIRGPQSGS
ncbi:MAG: hypothetical protein KC586_26085, partial [Myxococcales bacterium]|nr:hypothetical protein [Myxococcales bacterium]